MNRPSHLLFTGITAAFCRHIKRRIKCVEVFKIKFILYSTQCFAESLIVNDFSRTQESDWINYVRIFYESEYIIIGSSCFLFCSKVFVEVCDRISFRLEFTCIKRNSSCRLRPDSNCMVNIIRCKTGAFYFLH